MAIDLEPRVDIDLLVDIDFDAMYSDVHLDDKLRMVKIWCHIIIGTGLG